jgi:hypothetical protein
MLTACALMGMKQGIQLLQQSFTSGNVVDRPDALVSFEELNEIMGIEQVQELEARFLTPAQKAAKYKGDGAQNGTVDGLSDDRSARNGVSAA